MIKSYNNFTAQKPVASFETLPIGAYGAKITSVEVRQAGTSEKLVLSFDISNGPYAGWFESEYKNNQYEDKRWKGTYTLWLPKDDGSEKDTWTKNAFERAIGAIESSNENYHWNWNEQSLVGLSVGVNMRNEQWQSRDGRSGWSVRCGQLVNFEDALSDRIKPMKDKPLKNAPSSSSGLQPLSDLDEELPF